MARRPQPPYIKDRVAGTTEGPSGTPDHSQTVFGPAFLPYSTLACEEVLQGLGLVPFLSPLP